MLRVRVDDARAGMRLALPVYHPQHPGQVLLRVGFELNDEVCERLRTLRVRSVWVGYPGLEYLGEFVNTEICKAQGEVTRQVMHVIEQTQNESSAKLSFDDYASAIGKLLDELIGNPKAAIFLDDMIEVDGDELMRHSSAAAYLSSLIGLRLEGYLVKQRPHVAPARAKSVVSLGLGAMLHDLGVTRLDPVVRQRHAETRDESDPAWQDHTRLGYQLVRGSIDPSAATVLLNHHQRFDGTGYGGVGMPVLDGERIHVFARIVGLVEQFDRWRHDTADGAPRPSVAVLHALLQDDVRKKFDPQVMLALLAVAPPYPPGSIVRLSDGRWVLVVDHATAAPCRPLVQEMPSPDNLMASDGPVGSPFDLQACSDDLVIAEFDDVDVTGFNFEVPEALLEASDGYIFERR